MTPENVNDQLQCLDRLKVCGAHPDEQFLQMAKEKKSFKEGQVLMMLLMLLSMVTHTAAHYVLHHVRC